MAAARVWEVTPHVGIGPLRLGMTTVEVRAAVFGHSVEEVGRGREEIIDALGLSVDYSAGKPTVTFIQAFPCDEIELLFAGRDVFGTSADEMVSTILRQQELDPVDYPPGEHEYRFPTLRLVLWRDVVAAEPGEQGWTFASVSVHALGYYETE